MLDVQKIYENLTDEEREEMKKLLLSDVEETKEDEIAEEPEYANAEVKEVTAQQEEEAPVVEEEAETPAAEAQSTESTEESTESTFEEKQAYLIKFGYDPTNVKYMNSDILDQAYASATKIRGAEAGDN